MIEKHANVSLDHRGGTHLPAASTKALAGNTTIRNDQYSAVIRADQTVLPPLTAARAHIAIRHLNLP